MRTIRPFILLLLFCTALLLGGVSVEAADVVASGVCDGSGNDLTWTLDTDGLLTISGKGAMDSIYFRYAGVPWSRYRDSIQSVVIGRSVTNIGDCAFYGCSSLTSVVIPDSVTNIGDYAFYGCSCLTSIVIPDSVTYVGSHAFEDCGSLTNIVIPDSVSAIGYSAFYGCSCLTSVVIPDSVSAISDSAFSGCSSLTGIVIPDSVETIENCAFSGCSSLTGIVIPGSVSAIGYLAFSNCSSLTDLVIEDGLTAIRDYAFFCCEGLTYVNIPDSVTTIGNAAFYWCRGLISIDIADSVTSIGDSAFYYCSSLTSVDIPDSVTSIGNFAFYDCDSLINVDMPAGLTSIGDSAFYDCDRLTSLDIPDSLTSIGDSAFFGCDSLTGVDIPHGLSEIGDSAFASCRSLTGVNISDGVTGIGSRAFYQCSSITGINIPDSVTSIGDLAFDGCTGLTSLVIGDGVSSIGAFGSCSNLTSLVIGDGVTAIEDSAFYNCWKLESLVIGNGVISIGDHAFFNCRKLTDIVMGSSMTCIGDYAFYQCNSLTHVDIPDSVTHIGEYAFYSCHNPISAVGALVRFDTGLTHEQRATGRYVNWAGISTVSQFRDENGNFAFAVNESEKAVTIYKTEYGKITSHVTIMNPYERCGAVLCDGSGNFYIIWGRNNEGDDMSVNTVFISKYRPDGTLVATVGGNGSEGVSWYIDSGYNSRIPFDFGNCDAAINGDILMVNYARGMYNGHQSSTVFAVNIRTMEKLTGFNSYTSHSFDQRVTPYQDGFLLETHGDGYPRTFTTVLTDTGESLNTLETFHFWVEKGTMDDYDMSRLNRTRARLGNILETGSGAALVGASVRSLSEAAQTEPQDLFVQVFDPAAGNVGPAAFVTEGTRSGIAGANGDEQVTDYGVLWLTELAGTGLSVDEVQAVSVGDSVIAVLYELYQNEAYHSTWYMLLKDDGSVLKEAESLGQVRLNQSEDPVYAQGAVQWFSSPYLYSLPISLNELRNEIAENQMDYVFARTDVTAASSAVTMFDHTGGNAAVQYVLAAYSDAGQMVDCASTLSTDGNGGSVSLSVSYTAKDHVTQVKAFVLQSGALTPLCESWTAQIDIRYTRWYD